MKESKYQLRFNFASIHLLVTVHFCNAPAYQSTMAVYASYEQDPPHRCAALHHTRAASQRGEQPSLKLHAARAKLSPVLNQLIRFGYPDCALQLKLQTNPEGLVPGEQELNWETCSSCQINVARESWWMEVEGAVQKKCISLSPKMRAPKHWLYQLN